MKIMLVDDSRTMRDMQKKALAQLGHKDIVEAADGVEALAAYKESRPDLMLIDWNMPNMDGITLVKTIRQTDKSIVMIMCTTETEQARKVEAVMAGVNNYIVKPFTAETLLEKINQTLSSHSITAS